MDSIKKILVVGGPGSGKSVLSFNLGKMLDIPVYHLDEIHIKCDTENHGKKNRNNNILRILKNDAWIMDGNYRSTLKERIKECDAIIFLDYSTFKLVYGVLFRSIKNYNKIKKEIPGRVETFDLSVIMLAYNWRKEKRPDVVKMLNQTDKKTYIFKSRRKLNTWFQNKFKEKIRRF